MQLKQALAEAYPRRDSLVDNQRWCLGQRVAALGADLNVSSDHT